MPSSDFFTCASRVPYSHFCFGTHILNLTESQDSQSFSGKFCNGRNGFLVVNRKQRSFFVSFFFFWKKKMHPKKIIKLDPLQKTLFGLLGQQIRQQSLWLPMMAISIMKTPSSKLGHIGISKRQRHWNDRFYQKFIIKSLNLYKTFTRRTSNGIMDGFIRKVNQKVNLPGFAILKDRFLKTRPIKRFHICLKM